MTKKNLNLFTILFFTFIFLLNACDIATDDKEETTPTLVGTWQTEESFNSQKGMKCIYEIASDNKFSYKMEYIYDVKPDNETVLIKKGEFVKISGNISITENKIIATDLKVSEESTISKDVLAEMIKEPLSDMEIEYKDLTESSVKILQSDVDDEGNEIETWTTLVNIGKSTETDNKGDNTEYSIIGTWKGSYETTVMDNITMKMDVTYTVTDKSFTSTTKVLEDVVIMDTVVYPAGFEQTNEAVITQVDTSAKLIAYKVTDPETNETIEDFIAYRNLTATTVEFMIPGMNGEPNWLTFTKIN